MREVFRNRWWVVIVVGPFLSGLSHDIYHSYAPAFALYELVLVVACLVFVSLVPYAFPVLHRLPPEAEPEAVPA